MDHILQEDTGQRTVAGQGRGSRGHIPYWQLRHAQTEQRRRAQREEYMRMREEQHGKGGGKQQPVAEQGSVNKADMDKLFPITERRKRREEERQRSQR